MLSAAFIVMRLFKDCKGTLLLASSGLKLRVLYIVVRLDIGFVLWIGQISVEQTIQKVKLSIWRQ